MKFLLVMILALSSVAVFAQDAAAKAAELGFFEKNAVWIGLAYMVLEYLLTKTKIIKEGSIIGVILHGLLRIKTGAEK